MLKQCLSSPKQCLALRCCRLPREQTLGEEARRRVPAEFRRQSPSVANPPTLMLLADAMAKAHYQSVAGSMAKPAAGGVNTEAVLR